MIIYKIVDNKTGKGYIGKTERPFRQRVKEHLTLLLHNRHHNPYLQNIFNKDAKRISFQIIEEHIYCLQELNRKEVMYIAEQGVFNIAKGGEGGDTISTHPSKEEIFKKRSEQYSPPKGEASPNYKKISVEQQEVLLGIWKNLKIKTLKEISNQSGLSKYLCKRVLLRAGEDVKDRHESQKALREAGILLGSRNPNFSQEQKEYIKNRYLKEWIGCKQIAKELGFKSESPILKVIEELNIKRSKSDWTTYNNLKRKNKNE